MTNAPARVHIQDVHHRASHLFKERAYINGRWVDSPRQALTVSDPATGDVIGSVPDCDDGQVNEALDVASAAFDEWRRLAASKRGEKLRRWATLVLEFSETLATIVTAEQGKPLAEARSEIAYAASFLNWFAAEAERVDGSTMPPHRPGVLTMVTREPIGVAAAITPWNFPSAMLARKAGAALAAGCPVVALPSSETPFSALALAALAEEAGVPGSVFQVVTGNGERIGGTLASDARVNAVSFTGSTVVGQKIFALAAQTMKRLTLELGGHAPFIVLSDAVIDDALEAAIAAKYATSGQDCLAVNRFYVQGAAYDAFVEGFLRRSEALTVGNGFVEGTEIGPLATEAAVQKCEQHVADAVAKGARLLTGGERHPCGKLFYRPTVLAEVTEEMLIAHEETFGPVAAIMRTESDAEAVRRANDSKYGLAAYVMGANVSRVLNVTRALDYGMVGVNTPHFTGAPIPFGGIRQSGVGREGGRHGIESFTELKYVCIGALADPREAS